MVSVTPHGGHIGFIVQSPFRVGEYLDSVYLSHPSSDNLSTFRHYMDDNLKFNRKLERAITFAWSVNGEPYPEAPWYGVWGVILNRMASYREYLVTYPQPRIFSGATVTHQVPDFDVSEVINCMFVQREH